MTPTTIIAVDVLDKIGAAASEEAFWGAAAVIVAITGVRATVRAAAPRRRLNYHVSTLPLFAREGANGEGLRVSLEGRALDNPRLVQIHLSSEGTRDITSAHFDQERPIVIELDRPILRVVNVETFPAEAAAPPFLADGSNRLEVGPGRLGKDGSVTYTLLIDGHTKHKLRHSLTDVKVKESKIVVDECL